MVWQTFDLPKITDVERKFGLEFNTSFIFLATIIHNGARTVQPTTVQLHVHRIASVSDHQMMQQIVFKEKVLRRLPSKVCLSVKISNLYSIHSQLLSELVVKEMLL